MLGVRMRRAPCRQLERRWSALSPTAWGLDLDHVVRAEADHEDDHVVAPPVGLPVYGEPRHVQVLPLRGLDDLTTARARLQADHTR